MHTRIRGLGDYALYISSFYLLTYYGDMSIWSVFVWCSYRERMEELIDDDDFSGANKRLRMTEV